MIREVTMYQAVCDGCGRVFGKVYSDIDTAVRVPFMKDLWAYINDKLYCPDCYEYDEETDEYKPKKKEE